MVWEAAFIRCSTLIFAARIFSSLDRVSGFPSWATDTRPVISPSWVEKLKWKSFGWPRTGSIAISAFLIAPSLLAPRQAYRSGVVRARATQAFGPRLVTDSFGPNTNRIAP